MTPDHPRFARPRLVAGPLLLLSLALCASTALAERLSIRTFSSDDGLGSSFVAHIMQDSAGYLWFATRDGLSRWNGYEFTTIAQAGGFTVPAIDRAYQTRSGDYFVICNDGSLYSYRPPRTGEPAGSGKVAFRRLSVSSRGEGIRFTRLFEDRNGVLWGGGHGVLVKGLGSTNVVMSLDRSAPPFDAVAMVHALGEDRTGALWVGTNSGLVRVLPDGRTGYYSFPGYVVGDAVTALALDDGGRIWAAHNRIGVVVLNPAPADGGPATQVISPSPLKGVALRIAPREGEAVVLTTANGLPANGATSLLRASDGQIWIGTGKGLARFDGTSIARYTRENGLCDNLIHELWEDADRHLWVATPSGAMRIVLEGFFGYTVTEGLATDWVVAIGETPGEGVYAIGVDWSINAFDGTRFRAARLPVPASSSTMWASQAGYRDRQGRWWALTNQGLYRFERSPGKTTPVFSPPRQLYTRRDGLPSSHVFRLYQDRSGALWVGTRSGEPVGDGLGLFDGALDRIRRFGPAEGLPLASTPSAFAEDRRGDLWVGFYQGGLARRRNGRFRLYTSKDGIPGGLVTSLVVDRAGRLWISTNLAGVSRVDDPSADPPKVRTYSTEDGLASNNVRAMAEDRDGRIYAGSARGVDRLDPASGRFRHYGSDDGFVKDFVTSAFCDSRGDLWFGTYGGVFRLVPAPERRPGAPPIAITGIRVAGESLPVAELGQPSVGEVVLGSDQRDIAIDFVSVSRHRARGIRYQYTVDAREGTWSAPTQARSVNFARLSPGSYRFAVRAVTAEGAVSGAPATVAFTIRPPVWQRSWFVTLAGASFVAILLGLYRYRVHRLLELERLRTGIASDLHDEVATNLSSIAMFSSLAQGELAESSPFLERITVLATESVEAIREIIWSIDPREETIASLIERLRDGMVISCRARGIRLTVSAPSDGTARNLTPEQRKNLWLMLKEAIANAVKHSGGTELAVTAAPAGRHVRITVWDNGDSPSPSAESSGRGLATMRARAEALGGTVAITSVRGEGTTVEFLVRLSS